MIHSQICECIAQYSVVNQIFAELTIPLAYQTRGIVSSTFFQSLFARGIQWLEIPEYNEIPH